MCILPYWVLERLKGGFKRATEISFSQWSQSRLVTIVLDY